MKKVKIILSIFIILVSMIINVKPIYASAPELGTIISGGDSFVSTGEGISENNLNSTNIKELTSPIYNTLLAIGIVAALIMSAILGMRFILGSVEEKATVKDQLVPFLVGCIVVFGAFGIWKLVVDLLNT